MSTQQQRKAKARARHEAYVERQHAKARSAAGAVSVIASVAGVAVSSPVGWFLVSLSDDARPTTRPAATEDVHLRRRPPRRCRRARPPTWSSTPTRAPSRSPSTPRRHPRTPTRWPSSPARATSTTPSCHRLTTEGIYRAAVRRPHRHRFGRSRLHHRRREPAQGRQDGQLPRGHAWPWPSRRGGEAGSQFFLVYEDTTLPPDYTIVGQITEGLDVVRRRSPRPVSHPTRPRRRRCARRADHHHRRSRSSRR